jgi:hypothetical protein
MPRPETLQKFEAIRAGRNSGPIVFDEVFRQREELFEIVEELLIELTHHQATRKPRPEGGRRMLEEPAK